MKVAPDLDVNGRVRILSLWLDVILSSWLLVVRHGGFFGRVTVERRWWRACKLSEQSEGGKEVGDPEDPFIYGCLHKRMDDKWTWAFVLIASRK